MITDVAPAAPEYDPLPHALREHVSKPSGGRRQPGNSLEANCLKLALIRIGLLCWSLTVGLSTQLLAYDPLELPAEARVKQLDVSFQDMERQREIPLKLYFRTGVQSAPIVIFSHGLGGSRNGSSYLGEHWAQRGYVAVFVQHPGSDESVWKNARPLQRMNAMREAASAENTRLRVQDISAVIDQLETWVADNQHELRSMADLKHVGMSGHSFGALTTQLTSGETLSRLGRGADPRIRAAIPMSPSAPPLGNAENYFGKVSIPWLLMTGTNDVASIGGATLETRLAVYPALPPGHKYELVLNKAEHSAFTEGALPGDRQARNPNHHRVILALSTAFWDAYLKGDPAAQAWLDGDGPRSVLEPEDRWQRK